MSGIIVMVDLGLLSILVVAVIAVFSFVWGRYLSKLDSRYQTLMDVIAIVLSGLVILSFAMGWALHAFGYVL